MSLSLLSPTVGTFGDRFYTKRCPYNTALSVYQGVCECEETRVTAGVVEGLLSFSGLILMWTLSGI